MSKNSRRHRRAFIAGAHTGIARLRALIAPLLPADARSALDKMAANVTAEFPMPPASRRDKAPARHAEEVDSHG